MAILQKPVSYAEADVFVKITDLLQCYSFTLRTPLAESATFFE